MSDVTCDDVRPHLRGVARGEVIDEPLRRHVATCADCARDLEGERLLDDALSLLSSERPPAALVAKLDGRRTRAARVERPSAWSRAVVPLMVAAALCLVGVDLLVRRDDVRAPAALARLDEEAVNDHLRVVFRGEPDIPSGGVHQVKPWFTGKLDFAPDLRFGGDDDFPLTGGSLAYFVDRKAAAFLFARRLHTITLLLFRADDLAVMDQGNVTIAGVRARESELRGFHVLSFRRDGQGYELISDVDPKDLRLLAEKLLAR